MISTDRDMITQAATTVASLADRNIVALPYCPLVTERVNKVNYFIYNELKFYSSNSLSNNTVKYPLTIVTISLRGGENSRQTLSSGLT